MEIDNRDKGENQIEERKDGIKEGGREEARDKVMRKGGKRKEGETTGTGKRRKRWKNEIRKMKDYKYD